MDKLISEIASTIENTLDAKNEVDSVLNEIKKKANENSFLNKRLVRWGEVGENQHYIWELEIGNFIIRFDLNDVINNIGTEQDENGFPIPKKEIEIDKIENAVKQIISSKIKVV